VDSLFWRIAISLVGVALLLIALSNLALYFFGTTAPAAVSRRRVGGSDDGRQASQRYEWSVDYTFRDKTGGEHSGHTTRRGGDTSPKTDSRVYYFPFAPFVSALESEAKPSMGQAVMAALGALLIFVMNGKRKRRPATAARTAQALTGYDDSVEELFHEP
ncbi:MAG: hypothetical protein PHE09_13945, partial [Oscillospiraceae bacterium]|nr:hypothetical protein [Oscillospiraceae bacterium]